MPTVTVKNRWAFVAFSSSAHPTKHCRRNRTCFGDTALFSKFFIDRPIFAAVLSIVVVFGDMIALFTLPVAQYPDITPPTVEVSAAYPAANAQVVTDTVAAPLQQH